LIFAADFTPPYAVLFDPKKTSFIIKVLLPSPTAYVMPSSCCASKCRTREPHTRTPTTWPWFSTKGTHNSIQTNINSRNTRNQKKSRKNTQNKPIQHI